MKTINIEVAENGYIVRQASDDNRCYVARFWVFETFASLTAWMGDPKNLELPTSMRPIDAR